MKKLFNLILFLCVCTLSWGQYVSAKWELGDVNNLASSTVSGQASSLVSTSYLNGTNIAKVEAMTAPNVTSGFEPVTYNPAFAMYYVDTKQTTRTAGRCVSFGVTPQAGHTFKPTRLSFDAAKCGTDGGNIDVIVKPSGGSEISLADAVQPLRNSINATNSTGYSHHEYVINDQLVEGKAFIVILYIYNINGVDVENPKSIAFRNVQLEGMIDEPIFTAEHYVSALTCKNAQGETINLSSMLNGLKNGTASAYPTKLQGEPKDFVVTAKQGYTATCAYNNKVATVTVKEGADKVFGFDIRFTVTNRPQKPEAKPLGRGLIAVNLSSSGSSGNLVSWRHRESDPDDLKYKLYRGTNATTQTTKVNSGNFITGKTNFRDASGTNSSYYKLEIYDKDDNLLETATSGKAWANQSFTVPLGSGPTDPDHGAGYTPNDASFCDMDGDGEYEIILKWSPTNEKDAASTGTTSSPYFDCLKLDGTRLWRIRLGDNFFTSAHTIQFIAWDFDGDGYGEFMCKTAPGTIDGEGNYVLLGNDSPNENFLSGRGKQDHGPEYITVFDGMTGAEISTIPYHTDYQTGQSYWGDSNQNRSERYLAALAYLDGPDKNPSPIFARGYYSGAFIGAYDFDGEQLTQRWVHRAYSASNGVVEYGNGTKKTLTKTVHGDGAHWISVGDVDGDGKQEIIYGSSCLDDDGTTLYRTGLGHGDALHLGDMIPENPGLEVLMCHEHSPYGIDIRDAKTGTILQRQTESGDTGRGLAAHFDSSRKDWQFLTSARSQMYNCSDQSVNANSWAIGSSGAGINCRVYWDGDLYDEFFDKSVFGHWNGSSFDRIQFNGGNYLWGNLNNGSKNNPCVLGDLLGDWREEIVTWTGDAASGFSLYINSTNFETQHRLPHLMDDLQYRVQVVNQNVCYNQPPHLSYDPAVRFAPPPTGVVEPGTYYIRNVSTGKYLQAGEAWGTRAVIGAHATVDFTLKLVADNTYTFDSNISNGGNSHFLSADQYPYVDGNASDLTITKRGTSAFRINNGTGDLLASTDSAMVLFKANVSLTNKLANWQFATRQELIDGLSQATVGTPLDATFLIQDPNFGRNDQRYSAWKWSSDCTNKNNSGANENFCVESWHSTFTFSQTLQNIPNGYYALQAQGFYRIDEQDATAPVLFANEEESDLPVLTGNESSMEMASAAFTAGQYEIEPVLVNVTDGTLNIGVRNAGNTGLWVIWDNFRLSYYGTEEPTGIESVSNQTSQSASQASVFYNLNGQRIAEPSRHGIYIKDGRKLMK